MTGWDVWTWVSIAVLVLGAPAIFVWFLVEALPRLFGRAGETDPGRPE